MEELGPEHFDDRFANISERSKLIRRKFIGEYIKDYNATAAVGRMGYKWESGQAQLGWKLLHEPYTQYYLARMIKEMDEKAIVGRNDVLHGLLKEANENGLDASHAARISAWRALAKALGMEITKVEVSGNVGGGVMAVPMATSPEEWERNCAEAQAKLKAKAKQ